MSLSSVLVANRGEIARRVIRAARSLGWRTVAVYVAADADAPYVHDADEAVRLETTYLDVAAIIAAAQRTGAQAIHPGYGFLSENAEAATSVEAAGLVWVGPTPATIAAMGDKVEAKRRARAAGVPTLPSSEDPSEAEGVGFPLLVKAAAGGGGKGMRRVERREDLVEAVAAARREAASAFGDDRVFLERYVARARHLEVQILGDAHGALVALGERECSIQRRHQKLIEESPSPVLDDEGRAALVDAALSLGRSLDYRSTGTVEFLYDDATREFFFLEVNTRLQVEHPVTEEVTGVDLVVEQLRVADGLPLRPRPPAPGGWAIEARLCAEDPANGFLPAAGTLAAFEPADEPAVRLESGVVTGSVVSVAFDSLLAKVIAHGATREEAAGRLARALERLHLAGVTTNRDFLAATLRHPAFIAGDTTTDFIERHQPAPRLEPSPAELTEAAVAAALWVAGENAARAEVLGTIPPGWRNARLPDERVVLRRGEETLEVAYRRARDGSYVLPDGTARVHAWSPTALDVEVRGRRWGARVSATPTHLHVQVPRGTVSFERVPRFRAPSEAPTETGGLAAPMPGVVIDVRVRSGERVRAGATLVVLEAMKMEHPIVAPHDGVVGALHVVPGDQVEGGADLLVLTPIDEEA